MNRILALLILLALLPAVNTGAAAEERVISVQHDAHRGVTCWVLNDAAELSARQSAAASAKYGGRSPAEPRYPGRQPTPGRGEPCEHPYPAQASGGIPAMTRQLNGPLGLLLVELYRALQRRDTTFGQILSLSAKCGIDGRQVLADHFAAPAVIVGSLEA